MQIPAMATAGVLVLLLGACAGTRAVQPLTAPLAPSALRGERSLGGVRLSAAAWPAADWWQSLEDPQLDALIREALKDSPDLAAAEARARAAEAAAGIAGAERAPVVDAGGSIGGARLPETLLEPPMGRHFNTLQYGYFRFGWDLDLWGGKRDAWEAAVGRARAADIAAHAGRLQVSANVVRAYARLAYAFAERDNLDAELERARHVRELTRQRVAAGIDDRLQLRQSDAEVAIAERRRAAARREVSRTRIVLAVLLGKGPDRGLDIHRPRVPQPAELALPSNLPARLLGRRPDVIAARWRVQAARKDIETARTEFLPDIGLRALAGFAAGGGTRLFQAAASFYQVAPAVSLPIFDGGRRRSGLAGRAAGYDMAVARYDRTLVAALNQIADILDALRSLELQNAAQQRALRAARDAWGLALQRYEAGVGSYLQTLMVRRQLLAVERGGLVLHARQIDLSVQLVQALGGGFRPRVDEHIGAPEPKPDP